jgi:hypothetical protein
MSASTDVDPQIECRAPRPPADVLRWVSNQLAWEHWLAGARERRRWEAARAELEVSQATPSSTAPATSSSR